MAQEWRELLAKRNRTSKTRRLWQDDHFTNKYSWDGIVGTSVHYEEVEDSDEWLEVDPRIVPSDEPGWDWEMQKSHWRFLVRNGGWFAAEKKGVGIGFRLERIAYLNIDTKEFETIRTASYGTPTVDVIEHDNALLANPLGKLTWANLFPGADYEIHVSPDKLHQEVHVSQATRDAMPMPPYPAADTYLVLVYEVDWGQVPGLADDDGDIDYDTDFERQARLYLKNHQGEIISVLPASRAWPEGHPVDEDGEPIEVPLRKRFIKVGDQHYLLMGAPVLALNALPEGTIIFDPDVDVAVGADDDDATTKGTTAPSFKSHYIDEIMAGTYQYYSAGWKYVLTKAWCRWLDITIDQGLTIDVAYITPYARINAATPLTRIWGIDEDDTATFSSDPSGRDKTTAYTDWDGEGLSTDPRAWVNSPSMVGIIQEIVNREGWESGNAIGIHWEDDGSANNKYIACYAYEHGSSDATLLHIEYTAGGETFYEIVTGAFTSVGVVTKKTETPRAGAITFVGVSLRTMKFARSVVAGTLTMSGTVLSKAKKALTGAFTSSGVLVSKAKKVLAGTFTNAGVLARKTSTFLAGALTSAGVLSKKTVTSKTGAITFTGTSSRTMKFARTVLSGTITLAGAVAKKTSLSFAGALTLSGVLIGKAKKVLAGTLTSAGALAKKTSKSFAGTFTSAGVLVKKAVKAFAGGITFVGTSLRTMKFARTILAGALTLSGAVTKKAKKPFTGAFTSSGTLKGKAKKVLVGAITSSGVLAKKTTKSLAGLFTSAGTVIKSTSKSLAGTLTTAGAVATRRLKAMLLAGAITFSGAVSKKTSKILSGAASFAGAISKLTRRILSGALTFVGRIIGSKGRVVHLTLYDRSASLTLDVRSTALTLESRSTDLTLPSR